VYRGSENGYAPQVEGGFQRPGYVAADGIQRMVVTYDFYDLAYTGPDPADVAQLQVELAVANDYRVEVSSDRQVNRSGDTYFLPVTRARGNPGDGTNLQVLSLDYGLPTANRIAGLTLELTDLGNVRGNLEIDLNRRYRQYPNPDVQRHHTASEGATAWHLDLSHTARPFFSYLEAFSVDPDYTTSVVTAGADGLLDYGNEYEIYEFVEDNDDQDRRPDWRRKGWGPGDDAIFPGWDENNDLISDYNQNDNEDSPNLVPDYEEPFLRFHCDPPEFAFGVDMNHNGTVDRFENDSEPDLPYPRDRRGYNLYGGAFLGPDVRLTLGRLRTREIASRRRAQAHYVLLTGLVEPSSRYRLRFYQDARLARDEIPDDLVQWVQERNVRGGLQAVTDPLPARDTWVNTTWIGLDHRPLASVALQHKLKWEIYRQRLGATRRELLDLRRTALLLGLVDKAEHTTQLRDWTVLSRWKSQYLRRRPVRASRLCSHDLSQFLMILGRRGLMRRSYLQAGVEYEVYRQLADPLPAGADDSYTGLTTTCQVGNVSQYMGYGITTLLGFELRRLDFAGAPAETRTRAFITMYAGVQQ